MTAPARPLGRGLELLQALLDFFVGEHEAGDLKIAQAVSAGRGAVALESMSPADILAAARAPARPPAPLAVRAFKTAPAAAPASLAKSASFLSVDGRRIEVRFEFDPVFNLGGRQLRRRRRGHTAGGVGAGRPRRPRLQLAARTGVRRCAAYR